MIALIGAMQVETDGLINIMQDIKITVFKSFRFAEGTIEGKKIVVCRCGIGKVSAAAATALMIKLFPQITLVINLGVAGGVFPSIRQGDIVVALHCIQHDYDQTAGGLKKGQVDGFDEVGFSCDLKAVKIMKNVLDKNGYTSFVGTIVSGDQFINDNKKAKQLYDTFSAFACDMESASIAQVCKLLDTPFLAMRAISDNADGTAAKDFFEFVVEASQKSINAVKDFLLA